MSDNVTLVAAFVAGLLSFVSPCVLPLVPGYLSFVSGVTLDEMKSGETPAVRRHVLLSSFGFVLGFSLVFMALGASASVVGQFLMNRLTLLGKIAGAVIVLFGLHVMGVLRIDWLYTEHRVRADRKPTGPVGAALVGIAFAFGWTPCIGPILAAILAVAAAQDTLWKGVELLAVYSLGLGVPFMLASLALNHFLAALARVRRFYHAIEVASGLLLVVIGVLIFTNRLTLIAQYLVPYLPSY